MRIIQIRIHLAEAGHPLLGDRVYGRDAPAIPGVSIPRLMLHAQTLGFKHPSSGQVLRFEQPLPEDFAAVVASLRTT